MKNLVDFLLEISNGTGLKDDYEMDPLGYLERSGLSADDQQVIKEATSAADINAQIAKDPRADSMEIMGVAPAVFVDVRRK